MANENITGTFDHRATYEDFTVKNNQYGEPERIYSTYKELWVGRRYSGGNESGENKQEVAVNEIIFTHRYLAGIHERMRIYCNSKYYDIIFIAVVGRNEYHQVKCRVKDNQ